MANRTTGRSAIGSTRSLTVDQQRIIETNRIVVDPDYVPYDVPLMPDTWLEQQELGVVALGNGDLSVYSGEGITVNPRYFQDDGAKVEFSTTDELLLSIYTVGTENSPHVEIAGVRLQAPGASVTQWGQFELAYGTDGAWGGFITEEAIAAAGPWAETGEYLAWDYDQDFTTPPYCLAKLPTGEVDAMTFSNGVGDGGFPMSRGYDDEGDVVALVIWHMQYPWRLAVSDGTPPPDVTRHEAELAKCINGGLPTDDDGYCQTTSS